MKTPPTLPTPTTTYTPHKTRSTPPSATRIVRETSPSVALKQARLYPSRAVSPDCVIQQNFTDSRPGPHKKHRVKFNNYGENMVPSSSGTTKILPTIHSTCYIPKNHSEALGNPVLEISYQSGHKSVPCSKRARYDRPDRLSHKLSYSGGLWQILFYSFKQCLPKLLTSIDSPKLENINLSDFQISIQTEEIYSKKSPQDFIIQILDRTKRIKSTNISSSILHDILAQLTTSSIRRYLKGQLITQFPFFFYTKPYSDRTDVYIANRFQPFFKNTKLLREIIFNSKHPSDELCQSLSELLDTDPSLSNLHPDVKTSFITMITDPSSQLNTAIRSCFKNYLEDLNLTVARIITHIQSRDFQDANTFKTNLLEFLQNRIQQ